LQAWQVPPHVVAQQKPSTQEPPSHSFAEVHALPGNSFATQVPALQ
jgi:hypothetical protein